MKKFKKVILAVLCVGVIFATTACGAGNNANDDAANDTTTGQNNANDVGGTSNGATDTNMNR